ncbi:MAG: flagellar hook-associated protein FlgL [bacterium]|nr:flagellar hook-associated protein FlgL [bacterium]
MRVTHRQIYETVSANLARQREKFNDASERVVSGKRINRPSDDPAGAADVLSYRSRLASLDRYSRNLEQMRGAVKMIDLSLESASSLLTEAGEIALGAANGWDGPPDLDGLADQVANLKNQIVGLANARMGDQYLFGGYDTATPPFDSNGVYQGDSGVAQVAVDEQTKVETGLPGDTVFGAVGGIDIFQALDDLETALRSGDFAGVQAGVDALADGEAQVDEVRAMNGFRAQRLEDASLRLSKLEVDTKDRLSEVEEADLTEAIMALSRQELALQVAMESSAKILQTSLLNFLD